jgi:homoserine dehydrogenase
MSVVTANKAFIAEAGPRYAALAWRHGVTLRYSAAVGGSAPLIETIQRAREAGDITSISGMLNGTCNWVVLGRCETGVSLQDAVHEAQFCGYAEADPAEDLSGRDSVRKLRILARHAFDVDLDDMSVDEITSKSLEKALSQAKANHRLRLIGTLSRVAGHIQGAVQIEWIGPDHPFAQVNGAWNALMTTLAIGETTTIIGRGAGVGRRRKRL